MRLESHTTPTAPRGGCDSRRRRPAGGTPRRRPHGSARRAPHPLAPAWL